MEKTELEEEFGVAFGRWLKTVKRITLNGIDYVNLADVHEFIPPAVTKIIKQAEQRGIKECIDILRSEEDAYGADSVHYTIMRLRKRLERLKNGKKV